MQRIKRRFARAGRADQGEDLTFGHVEIDRFQRLIARAVGLGQFFEAEHLLSRQVLWRRPEGRRFVSARDHSQA